jgi:hypothetical protein
VFRGSEVLANALNLCPGNDGETGNIDKASQPYLLWNAGKTAADACGNACLALSSDDSKKGCRQCLLSTLAKTGLRFGTVPDFDLCYMIFGFDDSKKKNLGGETASALAELRDILIQPCEMHDLMADDDNNLDDDVIQ